MRKFQLDLQKFEEFAKYELERDQGVIIAFTDGNEVDFYPENAVLEALSGIDYSLLLETWVFDEYPNMEDLLESELFEAKDEILEATGKEVEIV